MLDKNAGDLIYEDADPNPEYLITSIAEQGYSLETALADLIDNSISANADKIEILTDFSFPENIRLYIVDNGDGMSSEALAINMQFPSSSVETFRNKSDLGRFGLGLKTASFSQTRKFTVLSKEENGEYAGRTWDVDYLKRCGKWRIIVNTSSEIDAILTDYRKCTAEFANEFDDFKPRTLIVWQGLYKFDNFVEPKNRANSLIEQLNSTTREYLGIVFHRFMQRKVHPLSIRINHWLVEYFDPFPINNGQNLRLVGDFQRQFNGDVFKIEAYVLPAAAIKGEKKHGGWVTPNRNLMDLEGMYIYRGERVIYFGGWNGLIKREANLKLARLKVDVGNVNDNLLQLNVAKSKISIPYELQRGFLEKVSQLREEARKEYFNHGIREVSSSKNAAKLSIFNKVVTSKHGATLELNLEYPGIETFIKNLDKDQYSQFKMIVHLINVSSNRLLEKYEDQQITGIKERDKIDIEIILNYINELKLAGFDRDKIIELSLKDLGFNNNNLPIELTELLNRK